MIRGKKQSSARPAFVLIAVMIVVVLLSLAAYQFSDLMSAEAQASDSYLRSIQAQALADSGINYAAAILGNKDAFAAAPLNGNPFDNASAFQGIAVNPAAGARLQGRFTLFAPPDLDDASNGSQTFRMGVIDEAGKINLNALLQLDSSGRVAHDLLMTLPNMTEEIADAILDWLDADDESRASGAEQTYYSTLIPPVRCKNGPLDSLDELLLVRGVTPALLYGNDRNRNGVLDPDEIDGTGTGDRGWLPYLTIYSHELNVDVDGNPRINVNGQDLQKLHSDLSTALSEDLANFIVAYRTTSSTSSSGGGSGAGGGAASGGGSGGAATGGGGSSGAAGGGNSKSGAAGSGGSGSPGGGSGGKSGAGGGASGGAASPQQPSSGGSTSQPAAGKLSKDKLDFKNTKPRSISSLYELINAKVEMPGANPQAPKVSYTSPLADAGTLRQMLPLLLDKVATSKAREVAGRINVNTAPSSILNGLPGLDETDVQTILSRRPRPGDSLGTDPMYQTPAWLIVEANIDPKKVQSADRYITARTQVYRVQAVGYFDRGGPAGRVEAVIDANQGYPRVLYRRDLSELGKGFDPRLTRNP